MSQRGPYPLGPEGPTVSLMKLRGPESVQVVLKLGVLSISGTWKPSQRERRAAWELYVELITCAGVGPIESGVGLAGEAMNGLYSLFGTTREILRRYGPTIAQPQNGHEHSFGELAVLFLNFELRPLFVRWYPLLDRWEATRLPDTSKTEHQAQWQHAGQLREELEQTRGRLKVYADLLAEVAGVLPLDPGNCQWPRD